MSNSYTNLGWAGKLHDFIDTSQEKWLTDLQVHYNHCMNQNPGELQINAWKNCFFILKDQLTQLSNITPTTFDSFVIFEYELPRERGRRPDVVMLVKNTIFVLEFKDYSKIVQAHIDQTSAYVRDLSNYHSRSHGHKIVPILVLTKTEDLNETRDDVIIISPKYISTTIQKNTDISNGDIVFDKWVESEYSPLPSLISAARIIFNNQKLPQIRRAQSAGIDKTVEYLVKVCKQAREKHERHLILVTGVPGSGKTLVGLQFVYSDQLIQENSKDAVFLSGNGPLVQVLQHALQNRIFVQDVHGFLKQYGGNQEKTPKEHIWVYDEAQRAWDKAQVLEKRGHTNSEPLDFLIIGEKIEPYSVMIGLIGEGQEIHIGEEAGLEQWNDALKEITKKWTVNCPSKVAKIFSNAKEIVTDEVLDLTISLRSHLAEDVHSWVAKLLEGDISGAQNLYKKLENEGFDVYITRDVGQCKKYVRERYSDEKDKRYGLLASAKASNLPAYGIKNEWEDTSRLKVGPWYNDDPSTPKSCCQLSDVVTEFSCQGLELDFPIVCWGNDLYWENNKWTSKITRSKAHNPHKLRINSYRVLLTRGRDGFVIFVPNEEKMNSTYETLIQAGVRILE